MFVKPKSWTGKGRLGKCKKKKELKKKLEESSKEPHNYNFIRNQIKRTVRHYKAVYEEGRKEHEEKVRRLNKKYRKKPKKGD